MDQFLKNKYLNLETFRKSGAGVKTPVWFVQDAGSLYVKTLLRSGKVKRIRNNPQVKLVPSHANGKPKGSWQSGSGSLVEEAALKDRVEQLYEKKYGLLKKLFFRNQSEPGQEYCLLELKPAGGE
jgi:PPOX class probable F420-dependent enzyme